MKRRILDHFDEEERKRIIDEADVALKALAQTELNVGEDGATAVYAGVMFSHLAMLLSLDKPDRVTAFFDDLENSFSHIAGITFTYQASFELREEDCDTCNGGCDNGPNPDEPKGD